MDRSKWFHVNKRRPKLQFGSRNICSYGNRCERVSNYFEQLGRRSSFGSCYCFDWNKYFMLQLNRWCGCSSGKWRYTGLQFPMDEKYFGICDYSKYYWPNCRCLPINSYRCELLFVCIVNCDNYRTCGINSYSCSQRFRSMFR